MRSRIDLQVYLESIIESKNVYYQPPENYKLKYPCILYNQEPGNIKKASNKLYGYIKKYSITYITTIDDENIICKILDSFDYSSVDRIFVSDNLYHYVFTIYY